MGVTRERFTTGLTYAEYKAQMTRNRERLDAAESKVTVSDQDLAAFKKPLHVLALAEDWCGDVIANLPIMGKLAEAAGTIDLRIFLRDQNLDIMDQYLKEGKYRSIPVFVFFDQDFNQLGTFIERPDSVTTLRAEKRLELFAQHPEWGSPSTPADQLSDEVRAAVMQATQAMRDATNDWANREVVDALRAIVA